MVPPRSDEIVSVIRRKLARSTMPHGEKDEAQRGARECPRECVYS